MTTTKTKTKKAPAKKTDEIIDTVSIDDVNIYYNGVEYRPGKDDVQEVTFLGTKTIQAKIPCSLLCSDSRFHIVVFLFFAKWIIF